MAKHVLIAGGLCGTTMLRLSMDLEELCLKEGVAAQIKIQNLWETTAVTRKYDLIIEMFPFFTEEKCPVLNGKPFIIHQGEKELLEQAVSLLKGGGGGQP